MTPRNSNRAALAPRGPGSAYRAVLADVVKLLEDARRTSARAVNAVMTATYWQVGRHIVEHEQRGRARAAYGEELVVRLAKDLTARFGRGFGVVNLNHMKRFYLGWPRERILQTLSELSAGSILQTASDRSGLTGVARSAESAASALPLPWSHYVRLLSVRDPVARSLYETQALRGGWTVRELSRQIDSQFYERTVLSRNKTAALAKGRRKNRNDDVTAEDELKDPLVLEFLGLRDEYSEGDLEHALVEHIERFLLELGDDFAFVARQKRLRIDDEWYRVDLVFFHRRLRCLVIIDLKLGRFTHADAGQMHVYLNYARQHWTHEDENPPVGVILCAAKGEALVHYATDNMPNKMLVREYLTVLPAEKLIAAEITKTRRLLDRRGD